MKRFALAVCLGVVGLSLAATGCAAASDEGASSQADVVDEAPLTVDNFLTHPRIVAVRKDVAEIDRATLKKERRGDLCEFGEDFREKSADDSGKIRKVAFRAGTDHGVYTTTLYYGASGKPRFAFETSGYWMFDSDGEVADGADPPTREFKRETRVYFNEAGQRFFEVVREVSWRSGEPEVKIDTAPYAAPAADAAFDVDPAWETDPAGAYAAEPDCFE